MAQYEPDQSDLEDDEGSIISKLLSPPSTANPLGLRKYAETRVSGYNYHNNSWLCANGSKGLKSVSVSNS